MSKHLSDKNVINEVEDKREHIYFKFLILDDVIRSFLNLTCSHSIKYPNINFLLAIMWYYSQKLKLWLKINACSAFINNLTQCLSKDPLTMKLISWYLLKPNLILLHLSL